MPDYLRTVQENGLKHLVVLASADEIAASQGKRNEDNVLPSYFTQSGQWGDYWVDVEPRADTHTFGDLTLRAYDLTITSPEGKTTQVTVHHLENWPDKQTVREEALLAFAFHMQDQVGDFSLLGAHCKAGFGRTGSLLSPFGFIQDPSLRPADVLQAGREGRGPDFVQTNAQLETVVGTYRLVQAIAQRDQPRQVVTPDWPRESRVDPLALQDGQHVYMNLPPPPAVALMRSGKPI